MQFSSDCTGTSSTSRVYRCIKGVCRVWLSLYRYIQYKQGVQVQGVHSLAQTVQVHPVQVGCSAIRCTGFGSVCIGT